MTKEIYYNAIDNKVFTYSKQFPEAIFDSITAFVNRNFSTSEDRVRAYYTWEALNISYDTDHMAEIQLIKTFDINTISSSNQKAPDVLKNRKAVCEGYSNLMVEFCKASSIPCVMVCGYTKMPDGEIPDILHAWNAVKVDSAWFALDITWSSGYVNPMNTFVKRFSNQYFTPRPKRFIKDHFPLDPMWQLLKNPFSKTDFEKDSLSHSDSPLYNFPDSIRVYMSKPEEERRYLDFLHYYWTEPNNRVYARNVDVVNNNLVVDKLNIGGLYHTDFIEFAQTKLSKKPTIADCRKGRGMLDSAQVYYKKAQAILVSKQAITAEYKSAFSAMQKSLDESSKNVKLNYEYLAKLQAFLKKK